MLIPCSRIQVIFAIQGVRLDRRTPAFSEIAVTTRDFLYGLRTICIRPYTR